MKTTGTLFGMFVRALIRVLVFCAVVAIGVLYLYSTDPTGLESGLWGSGARYAIVYLIVILLGVVIAVWVGKLVTPRDGETSPLASDGPSPVRRMLMTTTDTEYTEHLRYWREKGIVHAARYIWTLEQKGDLPDAPPPPPSARQQVRRATTDDDGNWLKWVLPLLMAAIAFFVVWIWIAPQVLAGVDNTADWYGVARLGVTALATGLAWMFGNRIQR